MTGPVRMEESDMGCGVWLSEPLLSLFHVSAILMSYPSLGNHTNHRLVGEKEKKTKTKAGEIETYDRIIRVTLVEAF